MQLERFLLTNNKNKCETEIKLNFDHTDFYKAFLSLITKNSADISPGFNPQRSITQSSPDC